MMGANNKQQEPQHYQLKWNNHHANLSCVFEQLLQQEAFTDVTIACDGSSLKCHKMVLAACSSYFQKLFTDTPCQHPIVVLKDVHFSVFQSLLDFMYKGEVNISQEDLPSLMKLAENLKIKGLVEESSSPSSSDENALNSRTPLSSGKLSVVPPNVSSSPPLGPKFNVISNGSNDDRCASSESSSSCAGSVDSVRLAAKSGLLGALSIQHPILRTALGTGNGLTGSDTGSLSDPAEQLDPMPSISIERADRLPVDVNLVKKEGGIPSLNPIRIAAMPISVSHVPKKGTAQNQSAAAIKPGTTIVKAKSQTPTPTPGIKFETLLDPTGGNYPSIPPLLSTLTPAGFPSPLNLTSGGRAPSESGRASGGDDSSREWKRYKLYDREDLHAAIEEVKQGKSAAAAAKKFGIPSRTLYAKIKKLGIPTAPRKAYGRMVLNAQQYQKVSGSATAQRQQTSPLAAASFMQQIMRPLSAHNSEDSFYDDLRRAYLQDDDGEGEADVGDEESMDSSAANSRTPDPSSSCGGTLNEDDQETEEDSIRRDEEMDEDDEGNVVASVVVETELGEQEEEDGGDGEDDGGGEN